MTGLATRATITLLVTLLCAMALVGPVQARSARVGLLLANGGPDVEPLVEVFRQGLSQSSSGADADLTLIVRIASSSQDADSAAVELGREYIDVAVGASLREVQA